MIIAYVISESYSTSVFNGIKVQAETWADELERQGHKVIKVNPWESHSWENYDIIHIFGPCEFIYTFSASLSVRNNRIVLSPIIDTIQSLWKYRLVSLWGCKRLRLASPNYTIRQSRKYIKHWLVRSKYEYEYVNKSYDVPSGQISIIPLSYRIQECDDYPAKEHFCLHVSRLTDDRKNVLRLMKAAVKYNFKLVLAGSISSEDDFVPFRKIMKEYDNIIYLGWVSDEKLIDLYRRAKVFALPSINEGVGMVAVEAASYGCDIVVTEIGGPKEYYGDMAFTVNPYNIDEIGKAVCKAMVNMNSQPKLMKYIKVNYRLSKCVKDLVKVYTEIAHNE